MTKMEDKKLLSTLLFLARIWWFGPLSGAVLCVGFTNIVGVCLCLLYYLSNLSVISLNLIIVIFCAILLIFANVMVMLGAVKNKQQYLLPWLVITSIAILAAIIYCVVKWDDLTEFRVPLVASAALSIYFVAVVSSYYHELVAPEEMLKLKEKAAVATFTDNDATTAVQILGEEETVLVALDHEDTPPPPRHPCPEEVISIDDTNKIKTNPFLTDVFQNEKSTEKVVNETNTKPILKDTNSHQINLKSNFTPFKKGSKIGDKTPAKMKIFLPGTGGDESDFDFSFNDPDFDSSLCAESHPGVEESS